MLRRSFRRLGHQLIKEPMPNVEHDTLARGAATNANVRSDIQRELKIMAVGLVLGSCSILSAYSTQVPVVRPDGTMDRE